MARRPVRSTSVRLEITHPGKLLRSEFLDPYGITAAALARALCVPASRINAILQGRRSISADTALRLARFFGTTPEFWVNLQKDFELRMAMESSGSDINLIQPILTFKGAGASARVLIQRNAALFKRLA